MVLKAEKGYSCYGLALGKLTVGKEVKNVCMDEHVCL